MNRPINLNCEPIEVKHSDLERTDKSLYRSVCPKCKGGMLLVGRDLDTLELSEIDHCITCAQRFIYIDIQEMRDREKGK